MKFLRLSCASVVAVAAVSFSGAASAIPILNFLIDGDTALEAFSITNSSTTGEFVTGFHLDITSTGNCFDLDDLPADSCPGNFANGLVEFGADSGTDVLTGLVAPSVSDGDTILDLSFTDFGAGETFVWFLDVDPVMGGWNGTARGNHLIGATAYVDFSNGDRLFATLGAVDNNSDASAFTVRGIPRVEPAEDPVPVPLPSTLTLLAAAAAALGFRSRNRTC